MKLKKLWISLCAIGLLTGCGSSNNTKSDTPEKLVVAFIPMDGGQGSADTVYANLGKALSDKLDMEVETYEVSSYEAEIEALRTGKADIALFGTFSYTIAEERAEIQPLVSLGDKSGKAEEDPMSVIIVPKDSEIQTIEDLKGHSFAYVDPASTTGFVLPKYHLLKNLNNMTLSNLTDQFFSETTFAGGQDTVLMGVVNHQYDAGALAYAVAGMLVQKGVAKADDYRVIAAIDGVGSGTMVIRKQIPTEMQEKVKEVLLSYEDEALFQALSGVASARFVDVDNSKLEEVKTIAKELELSADTLLGK